MRHSIKYTETVEYRLTEEELRENLRDGTIGSYDYKIDTRDENSKRPYIVKMKELPQDSGHKVFEVEDIEMYRFYGYSGENDIREILDWFNEKYELDYTYTVEGGVLKSDIILRNTYVSRLVGVRSGWKDERSKWEHLRLVADEFLMFFDPEDKNSLPSEENFMNLMEDGRDEEI